MNLQIELCRVTRLKYSAMKFEEITIQVHCKYIYIYMYKTVQARVNTVAISTTGKSCSLYWELLHPILEILLASIGKLPFIGKLPIEA